MVVIDASVAFKWFSQDEPDFEKALQILQDHKHNTTKVLAPELLLYELANAWVTKTKMTIKQIKTNLKKLDEASIFFEYVSFMRAKKIATFAEKYKVSVCDASYAVLAREKKCHLVTADAKFVEQVNLPFVKKLTEYSMKSMSKN